MGRWLCPGFMKHFVDDLLDVQVVWRWYLSFAWDFGNG